MKCHNIFFIHGSIMENKEYLLHIHPVCQFFLEMVHRKMSLSTTERLSYDLKEAIKNQATMFQLNKLAQAIETLLQERTMEIILKEVKGFNRSRVSTLNSTRIRIKGFFYPLRGFQLQLCKRDMKKGLFYYCD